MAAAVLPYNASRSLVQPPRITLQFRLLREGEVTPGPKTVNVYRDWDGAGRLQMVFHADDGEWSREQSFDQATLLAQGDWLVTGIDNQLPRKTRAVYMAFGESAVLTYNITSGEGGGGAVGDPAVLHARVRVDGADASREVVVIEKPSDGLWRMAGYGPTTGGESTIDVRVTDGLCYAVALDDWGIQYQPNLAVSAGQTIRPSVYAGWLYRITEAGTLPATEPEWWPIDGDNAPRLLGTARAQAVRYYRPLAHGPVPVEMI